MPRVAAINAGLVRTTQTKLLEESSVTREPGARRTRFRDKSEPNGKGTQQHNGYSHANGNGRPSFSPTPVPTSREELMAEAMRVAVRVLTTTRHYAGEHEIDFKISEREVISLGCTVFINVAKEGR